MNRQQPNRCVRCNYVLAIPGRVCSECGLPQDAATIRENRRIAARRRAAHCGLLIAMAFSTLVLIGVGYTLRNPSCIPERLLVMYIAIDIATCDSWEKELRYRAAFDKLSSEAEDQLVIRCLGRIKNDNDNVAISSIDLLQRICLRSRSARLALESIAQTDERPRIALGAASALAGSGCSDSTFFDWNVSP
jgi:hypothetical protein